MRTCPLLAEDKRMSMISQKEALVSFENIK